MDKKSSPSKTAEQFIVRLPVGMRDEISAAAKQNNRSMNAEIVARLAKSFNPIDDEVDVMQAVHAIIQYSAKFNVSVSVQFSKAPEIATADEIRSNPANDR